MDDHELERRVVERTAELLVANDAAEQALRESEARFRALIENSFDVTAIADEEGVIRYVSPSVTRIFGFEVSQLEGATFTTFIHPDDVDEVAERFFRAARSPGQTHLGEFRARHEDGTWRLLDAVCLNQVENPAIRGIVFNGRDVTARRALEARLRQSERLEAVGQLAGGVAHDFNNILLVIRGYGSVLRSALEDPEQIADVDQILGAADRAAELTRNLLAFGRGQALDPDAVSVVEVLRGLESLLLHSIPENVELEFRLPDGVPSVIADSSQLEQVVVNLVVNARDAMPGGGRISLSVDEVDLAGAETGIEPHLSPGRYVVVSVEDTGSGIPAGVLPRVFEPFFTTKDDGRGTGLGLSTVHGIVAQSSGGIEVRTHVGRGTTFKVYLPVAAAEPPAAVDGHDARPTETVLLVEDERAVRDLVRRVLEEIGYRVLAADRPSEAERLLEEEDGVDLLLSDVVMPEMSGYELAARALDRRPGLRTMFMSGYSHPQAGEKRVPGELLSKPFTTEDLTRAVRSALDA